MPRRRKTGGGGPPSPLTAHVVAVALDAEKNVQGTVHQSNHFSRTSSFTHFHYTFQILFFTEFTTVHYHTPPPMHSKREGKWQVPEGESTCPPKRPTEKVFFFKIDQISFSFQTVFSLSQIPLKVYSAPTFSNHFSSSKSFSRFSSFFLS